MGLFGGLELDLQSKILSRSSPTQPHRILHLYRSQPANLSCFQRTPPISGSGSGSGSNHVISDLLFLFWDLFVISDSSVVGVSFVPSASLSSSRSCVLINLVSKRL